MTKKILANMPNRCAWCTTDPLYIAYHDQEWGVPLHDDNKLFELLILEGMQAGLSWLTVLKKRENFRRAFDHFDAKKMVRYSEKKTEKLLSDPGIIRSRLKIAAAISNAQAFLEIQNQYPSFDEYIWQFASDQKTSSSKKGSTICVTRSIESDAMSKDLVRNGFKFVGTTICYAFMQACGMVNDHEESCFLYPSIQRIKNCKPTRNANI